MNKEMNTAPLDAATFAFWGQKTHTKQKRTSLDKAKNAEKWRAVLSGL